MGSLKITVRKAQRTLEVHDCGSLLLSLRIALGSEPSGPKACEGDSRTPEGVYRVCSRNEKSKYHLALGLSYPGPGDAERGLAEGLIDNGQYNSILEAAVQGKRPPWDTKLGGEIMIHGGGTCSDWTVGCIALDDGSMDELWKIAEIGTEVEILP
jgi:murein L,D-transpeptidase YafK